MLNELFSQSLKSLNLILPFVWVLFAVGIYVILKEFWFVRITSNYMAKMEWVILEISVPKENVKSLKSMEQVFASLYAVYSFGLTTRERYIEGKIEEWLSLEVVGNKDGVRFYIRAPKNKRNLVESAFFSQYPNIEINEVEDYTKTFPRDLPNEEYDIFGTDLILGREDAYPIRTYPEFEALFDFEEKNVDPIAMLTESISHLKGDETAWIQVLVRPAGNDWIKGAQDVVDVLSGKKQKPQKKKIIKLPSGEFVGNLIAAPAKLPEWSEKTSKESSEGAKTSVTEGEALKVIQKKMAKRAYETIIRFVYIDNKNEFTGDNVASLFSSFQMFASQNINFFRPNTYTLTKKTSVSKIPQRRKKLLKIRKKQLYQAYLNRAMPQKHMERFNLKLKTSVFNIEELATIYHPPSIAVKAPRLHPLESKKGSPPVDLPTIE